MKPLCRCEASRETVERLLCFGDHSSDTRPNSQLNSQRLLHASQNTSAAYKENAPRKIVFA